MSTALPIPTELQTLASEMDRIATRMERECSGEALEHAVELHGAAAIARTWVEGMEADSKRGDA